MWTTPQVELNRTLRALWEQHIYWTRLTVNSIVGNLPDQNETIINDRIEPQALQMADVMTIGIIRQFPQAFVG
ncbi:hypothetical protein [Brevibacillus borstelensis]|uniref:hypothetical protein n=1 Tax=Brevibacillus borstelensis TaxID=45462 RepID=UPI0030C4CA70